MGAACTKSLKQITGRHGSGTITRTDDSAISRPLERSFLSPGSVLFDEHSGRESTLSSAASRTSLRQFPELAERYKKVMCGDLEQSLTAKAKIIRVFTSSTFTDMAAERNALMERIYPRLKTFAQEKGYEFQVVDMRWGVRDESTDDHSTLELCLKELKACQELSTGPNFMTFLGQKYGFRPLPSRIVSAEFEEIFSNITDQDEKTLLRTWYKCDLNEIPATYVLQPVSSRIPDYLCHDVGKRQLALEEWHGIFRQIQHILRREAKNLFGEDGEKVHKYFMSVTESEIRHGVLCEPEDTCVWISRNILDLKDHLLDENAQAFIDINSSSQEINSDAQELLERLKNDVVTKALPRSNIRKFELHWNPQGISSFNNYEHAQYINNLCREVEYLLKEKIADSIDKRVKGDVSDQLYDEVVEHLLFCQTKCNTFYGRTEILGRCKEYLQDDRSSPLVIHGQSGCGKTSVMSMVAKGAWNSSNQSNVIIRYIGTTPNSSQVRLLLHSVCQQICNIYGSDSSAIRKDMKELQEDFMSCLRLASPEKPLFIFLDSLDQFGPEDNSKQLTWLPTVLPSHVKLVVSTLPDAVYECFPILQSLFPDENFVEVPKLPEDDAFRILSNWLSIAGRGLSPSQQSIVCNALEKCSLPIFIRVAFDEAIRWKSYSLPNETVLQETVRGAVNALFERIETQHGRILVQHVLAYITASKSGLTGTEIEDLLSCDDKVLDDVYQYWTPPIRRIPPLLWVRIKSDLAGYLVDRGADGASVITWYHRQFIEAARDRYLSTDEERQFTHRALSDYFLGLWADGRKKPHRTIKGEHLEADRFVSSQPWAFEGRKKLKNFNYRKINELPYHLVLCNDTKTLKLEVLCNFEFLLTCLEAYSLRDLMDDFDFALQKIDDKDIQLVKETLQLSTFALIQHPAQLSTQLIGRVQTPDSDDIKSLLHQAQNSWRPCLLPSRVCLTSPGGPLVHSMSGHAKPSSALSVSADGKLIASASADKTCTIWDVTSGRLLRTLEGVGEDVWFVVISPDNSIVVTSRVGSISVWRLSNGQRVFSLAQEQMFASPVCIVEKENPNLLATIIASTIRLYDLQTGHLLREIQDRKLKTCSPMMSTLSLCPLEDQSVLYSGKDNVSRSSEKGWIRAAHLDSGEVVEMTLVNSNQTVNFIGVTITGMVFLALSEGAANSRKGSAVKTTFFTLELWDISNKVLARTLADISDKVRCYALSTNKSKALALGNTRFLPSANVFRAEIKVFDLISSEVIERTLTYPSSINLMQFIGSNHIITASRDKIVRLWDLDRNIPSSSEEHDEDVEVEIVDMYGYKAICWEKTSVCLVDLRGGEYIRFIKGLLPQMVFVNDNEVILVTDGKMHLFDLTRRQRIRQFDGNVWTSGLTNGCFVCMKHHVVAVSSDQCGLCVYDINTGRRTSHMQCKDIRRLVHTGNGDMCVCGHRMVNEEDPEKVWSYYSVWNLSQSKCIQEIVLETAEADFNEMQLAKDGSFLSDIIYDLSMKIYRAVVYDPKTGTRIFISETKNQVHSAAIISETGNLMLGLFDGTIELFDLANGDFLHKIRHAHLGAVHRIYTTDNGAIAMTTAGGLDSKDRSIRFWRLQSNRIALLTTFTPDAKVSSMNLSGDGHLVALEITDVVPFVLVGDSSRKKLKQLSNTDEFICSYIVDLEDFEVKLP